MPRETSRPDIPAFGIEGGPLLPGVLPHPYQSLDKDGCIVAVNAKWCEALGYSADEVVGHPFSNFLDSKSLAVFRQGFAALRGTGEAQGVELGLVRKDGSQLTALFSGTAERDGHRGLLRSHWVFHDVSAAKQAGEALAESEKRFRTLFEEAPIGILAQREGKVLFVNQALLTMHGYSESAELVGRLFLDLVAPERRQEIADEFRSRLTGKPVPSSFETVALRMDGSTFPVQVEVAVLELTDGPAYIGFNTDITARKQAEQALAHAKLKLERLHQASYQLAECRTEDEVCQLTVRDAEEILDFTLCTLDIVEGDKLVVKATSRELPPGASTESSLDEGLADKTYRTRQTYVFGSLEEVPEAEPTREEFRSGISAPIGDLGVFQVVSTQPNAFTEEDVRSLELLLAHTRESIKRIHLEKELKEQAIRDPLTAAYNRRFFNEVIEREMDRSKRYAHPVAFLMMDVNRFKEINDRFGHLMGDRVLQAVADVLRQNVRESDTVIRYGGDEFLVILPETNGKATAAVERIRATVARRNVENPLLDFPVTLAIGVDHWRPDDPRSVESVLIEADRRMYDDKKKSRA